MPKELVVRYTPRYKEIVFSVWYKNERPGVGKLLDLIPEDETGRKPKTVILSRWMDDGDWYFRADVLDEQASTGLDKELIEDRITVFKKHAEIGVKLQTLGLEFFETHDLKDEAVALRTILEGARLERESMGLTMALTKVFSLNDGDIQKEIQRLLNRSDKGEVVEGETKEIGDNAAETN